MEPQNPPSKIARISEHGPRNTSIGSINGGELEGSLPTGLGLGRRRSGPKNCGFTFLQLQELQHQALIYRYMEAGLAVPYHLILPIWKCVSSSLSGLNGRVHQHYPNFVGYSSVYGDYRNSMDPEPGRCRRTDGKKWRCSKGVVADQKYCEKHMHRGRQRSRKHVEHSQYVTTPTETHFHNSDTNLSISLPSTTNISPRLSFSP